MNREVTRALLAVVALAVAGIGGPQAAYAAVDQVLFDGESVPLAGGCGEYLQQVGGAGVGGTAALRLLPDPWHEPALNLYCGGKGRRDFTAHEVLEFRMRCEGGDCGSPTFRVRTWDQLGAEVSLFDYAEGGTIDGTWRLVRIPLADLATPSWSLGNVERLVWSKDPSQRVYYVDDVALRDLSGPTVLSVTPVSSTVLRVALSETFDLDTARSPANYALTSTSDAAYAGGAHPADVGVQVRFHDFGSGGEALSDHWIFLRFSAPMTSGKSYRLALESLVDDAGNPSKPTQVDVAWDDLVAESTAFKVNQVGYLPDRPKVGYVGDYLGDLGGSVWAVGDGGAISRWTPSGGWAAEPSPVGSRLNGVAATTETLALAAGEGGVVLEWDGAVWTPIGSGTTAELMGVTFGPTRIGWIVGANGTALRWANGVLTPTPTPTKATLRAVWAGPNDSAWAVGDGGTLLQWTGNAWSTSTSPTTADLHGIGAVNGGQLFAVGAKGTVIGRQWGSWTTWGPTPKTDATLRSVTTNPSGAVWVSGDGGLVWKRAKFGSDAFTVEPTGTGSSLGSISRLDERTIFAVGGGEALLRTQDGWTQIPNGTGTLRAVSALPYGALRLPEPPPDVTLFDADSGEAAYSAKLELRAANWPLSGEDVWRFDFTGLTKPGTYRAYLPGVGVSPPFRVATDALDIVAYTTARSFYYQRCGEALEAPYVDAGYERGLCHGPSHDAAYHASLPGTPLYAGEKVGATIDATGGWHDAGDFGKYMPTAAAAVWYLLEGYALSPEHFGDGPWNIPESGNGVPDVLDEAQVAVDWMVKIQGKDGGFPHKITAQCWFNGMPEEEKVQRYIFETTTFDTGTGAAVLASAARVLEPFDPVRAALYLQRAELAWGFLQAHPGAIPSGGFKNPSGNCTGDYGEGDDGDNRMWAAAELWRTTGDGKYRAAFEGLWQSLGKEWGWNEWQHHYRKAYWAYLRSEWNEDEGIRASIRDGFVKQADGIVSYTNTNPYQNGARLDVPEWIGWGTFTMGPKTAFPLLMAWSITGQDSYRDLAVINADAQLGTNPLSMSFITGLGARSPQNPLDMESEYDGVDAPVPGIPVFGPHQNQSKGNPFQVATQADGNNYPSTWTTDDPLPILRRFNDSFELPQMAEFTVLEQALTTVTFHLIAQPSSPLPPPAAACGGLSACDDGDPCTKDACDPDKGCVSTPNTAPCNDGDPCTTDDACGAGVCAGTPGGCEEAPEEPEATPEEPPKGGGPTTGAGDPTVTGPPAPGGVTDYPKGGVGQGGSSAEGEAETPSVDDPTPSDPSDPHPTVPDEGNQWPADPTGAEGPAESGGGDMYISLSGCQAAGSGATLPGALLLMATLGGLSLSRRRYRRPSTVQS